MSGRRSGPVVFVARGDGGGGIRARTYAHQVQGKAPQQDWKQPLVWLVVAILAVGVVVGTVVADARSPSYALGSELVYRLEIGAVTVGAMLFVLTTLRLASYGRTFTSFGAGPVKTEADDPASAMDAAVVDVEDIGARVDALGEVVAKLLERVDALERRLPPADAPR